MYVKNTQDGRTQSTLISGMHAQMGNQGSERLVTSEPGIYGVGTGLALRSQVIWKGVTWGG